MNNRLMFSLLLAVLPLCINIDFISASELQNEQRQREPVAACFSHDGRLFYVANYKSGSISIVDSSKYRHIVEEPVAQRLTHMVRLPGHQERFLLCDQKLHQLVLVDPANRPMRILHQLPIAAYPVELAYSEQESLCSVTSLWSRKLTVVRDHQTRLIAERVIDLPFPPRKQIWLDRQNLLVADAFAGDLALVQVNAGHVIHLTNFDAVNIRSLCWNAAHDAILVAHQFIDPNAQTTKSDIASGKLVRNLITRIPIRFENRSVKLDFKSATSMQLGSKNRGAADPTAILEHPQNKQLFVALAGTQKLAVYQEFDGKLCNRLPVGHRAAQILLHPDQKRLFIVNRLSDSISVVDIEAGRTIELIPLGPDRIRTPAEDGERLFHNAHLSYNSWLSCDSCHPDGHTTGSRADTLADGTYGTPKRILSLLGTADNNPWAWNGSVRVLHDQMHKSVRSSMRGDSLSPVQARQLVAYLHTLSPAPPKWQSPRTPAEKARQTTGKQLFNQLGCARCHIPPLTFTLDQVLDVGLADEKGLKKFNPPSLRGVSQRRSFFHDGRARSLREVFSEYAHQLDRALSDDELDALLLYLNSL